MNATTQVKLMEFDAALLAFLSAKGRAIPKALEHFLKLNDDIHVIVDEMAAAKDNDGLRTMLDAVEKADAMLDQAMHQLKLH